MVELEHLDAHSASPQLNEFQRQQPDRSWSDLPSHLKSLLKTDLIQEQHGLCAYCERRLATGGGRIDHIKPRSDHPHLTFSYSNLCVSCFGYYDQEGRNNKLSCDEVKADHSLGRLEPRRNVNSLIKFDPMSGSLGCALPIDNPDYHNIDSTIKLLGLHNVYLCNLRKGRFQALLGLLNLGVDPLTCLKKSDDFYWTLSEYFRSL